MSDKFNPYITGNPVGEGQSFIGRADVLHVEVVESEADKFPEFQEDAEWPVSLETSEFETIELNAEGKIGGRTSGKAQQFIEDLGNGVTLEMVAIPGGTFLMGSPRDEKGWDDNESPQHEVTVPPFLIGRYAESTEVQRS